MPAFPGFAPVQIVLEVLLIQFQAGRATIDNTTQCRAVTFTEAGDREEFSEAVS
jgi:hypothetical protein